MSEPILKPTYGVILYQEQVMQIAQELAGYTLGAADILRRLGGQIDAASAAGRAPPGLDAGGEHERGASLLLGQAAAFFVLGINPGAGGGVHLFGNHFAELCFDVNGAAW